MHHPPFHLRLLCTSVLVAAVLAACSKSDPPPPAAPASKPESPAPAASTAASTAASAAASAALPASQAAAMVPANALYQNVCAACHTGGVAGAPKTGNREDWQPRLAQGEAGLMQSVLNGKGAMPVKGTALDASEEELRETVRYMTQSAQ